MIAVPFFAVCQEIPMIQTFSSRIDNPVRITELAQNGSVVLMGENDSWFPYRVELKFNYLQNLSPAISNYEAVLMPGKRQLMKFRIISQNDSYSCPYSVRYIIGYQKANPDTSQVYCVPLTEGSVAPSEVVPGVFYKNIFNLGKGDTLVAMRKGIVTSTAEVKIPAERLFNNSTIEVLHDDNTISVYVVEGRSRILVREGEKIYPVEPLVISPDKGKVAVSLFDITKEGEVRPLNYNLENASPNASATTDIHVNHSQNLIEKEMDKKEKKKSENGSLYH